MAFEDTFAEDEQNATAEAQPLPGHLQEALNEAAKAREDLVIQWREVSKPNKQGAVQKKPKGAREEFAPCFEEWLIARGLSLDLEEAGYKQGWKVYRYVKEPVVRSDETWEVAFHGTWWYSLWMVLSSGVFLESNDRDKGHDFWEPGVYCSPNVSTARWYARPQVLFGDGLYHRVIFELRVNTAKRIRARQRGGVQWIFKPDAVALHAVWVQRNAPPVNGEERINDWDPALEALPPGETQVPATVNTRDPNDDWPEALPDEEGEEEVEDENSLPPHLQSSNPYPPPKPITPAATQNVIPAAAAGPSYYSRLRQWPPAVSAKAPAAIRPSSAPMLWQEQGWQSGAKQSWKQKGKSWQNQNAYHRAPVSAAAPATSSFCSGGGAKGGAAMRPRGSVGVSKQKKEAEVASACRVEPPKIILPATTAAKTPKAKDDSFEALLNSGGAGDGEERLAKRQKTES
eukprot:TRINITY_DN26725_c0_g1_i1.p1 TRINITY_DN26725_c0_g1~~TRINITY_DN26725_c0_g1_i1.p1  ORF type:complete len:458 (+),score=105.73 TRINITY_DN26725_c0_g1_i1:85-1458(+)